MRPRIIALAAIAVLVYGCATSAPPITTEPELLHGVASWYGEEFAGRTTANGEIFDPLLLTAAHRTLPFGTVIDVTNVKTSQTVRVRVNDRGPYIGNRMIDLSYAAAQKIGLIEPGTGEVDVKIVHLGEGDREPPAPMEVTIAEAPKTVPTVVESEAPKVDFPLPPKAKPAPAPVVVDRVEVEEHKQVAPDGRTKQFVVQVGAFAVEANAKQLQERLTTIGQRAWIDRNDLFRVRIGPFATRDLALQTRTALEASGISAIIVSE